MEQQIILITGATTGIGRHAALHLAKAGHRVIATGRNEKALADLARDAVGTELVTLRLDVTDARSVEAARAEVDRMTAGYGVDVLVNNAGYGSAAPLVESPDAEVRGQYETNVFGLLAVTRAFAPQMMDRRSGRILNVGSVGGRVTFPLLGAYNSTKYAVESLSDALRRELSPFGVFVSIIEPGPIKTEFSNRSVADVARYQESSSRYAKVFARTEEIKSRTDAMSAGPEVVVRAIERAIVSRRPAARYIAPFSSAVGLFFMQLMPTIMLDWVMRKLAGLSADQVGLSGPAKASVRPPRLVPNVAAEA
jgi:short-subunit dehydrogenase